MHERIRGRCIRCPLLFLNLRFTGMFLNHELVTSLCWNLTFVFFLSQGGIAFVAIKGAFKVYFKQQQYLRQAHRKILNFPEQEEAWDRTTYPPLQEWWEGRRRWLCRTEQTWAQHRPHIPTPPPPSPREADTLREHPDHHTLFLNCDAFVRWRRIRLVDSYRRMFAVTLALTRHIFPKELCVFSTIT